MGFVCLIVMLQPCALLFVDHCLSSQQLSATIYTFSTRSETPHLWYGHISMVTPHQHLFGPHMFDAFSTVCKSFLIPDVVSQDV
jgi:hypothetical protein